MKFLDTNVFIRYFAREDERKAQACLALLGRLERGEEEATISETIISEIAYVLSSRGQYDVPADEISARLRPVLLYRGLHLPNRNTYLRALDLYGAHPGLDFEDALTVAHMERAGISEIVSYDRDFDRIPGIHRIEP